MVAIKILLGALPILAINATSHPRDDPPDDRPPMDDRPMDRPDDISNWSEWNDDSIPKPRPHSHVHNYGCWCSFGDEELRGHGEPVDGMDKLCKKLTMCLRCPENDDRTACPNFNTPNIMMYNPKAKYLWEEACRRSNPDRACFNECLCYGEFFYEVNKHGNGKDLRLKADNKHIHKDPTRCPPSMVMDPNNQFNCPPPRPINEVCPAPNLNVCQIRLPGVCWVSGGDYVKVTSKPSRPTPTQYDLPGMYNITGEVRECHKQSDLVFWFHKDTGKIMVESGGEQKCVTMSADQRSIRHGQGNIRFSPCLDDSNDNSWTQDFTRHTEQAINNVISLVDPNDIHYCLKKSRGDRKGRIQFLRLNEDNDWRFCISFIFIENFEHSPYSVDSLRDTCEKKCIWIWERTVITGSAYMSMTSDEQLEFHEKWMRKCMTNCGEEVTDNVIDECHARCKRGDRCCVDRCKPEVPEDKKEHCIDECYKHDDITDQRMCPDICSRMYSMDDRKKICLDRCMIVPPEVMPECMFGCMYEGMGPSDDDYVYNSCMGSCSDQYSDKDSAWCGMRCDALLEENFRSMYEPKCGPHCQWDYPPMGIDNDKWIDMCMFSCMDGYFTDDSYMTSDYMTTCKGECGESTRIDGKTGVAVPEPICHSWCEDYTSKDSMMISGSCAHMCLEMRDNTWTPKMYQSCIYQCLEKCKHFAFFNDEKECPSMGPPGGEGPMPYPEPKPEPDCGMYRPYKKDDLTCQCEYHNQYMSGGDIPYYDCDSKAAKMISYEYQADLTFCYTKVCGYTSTGVVRSDAMKRYCVFDCMCNRVKDMPVDPMPPSAMEMYSGCMMYCMNAGYTSVVCTRFCKAIDWMPDQKEDCKYKCERMYYEDNTINKIDCVFRCMLEPLGLQGIESDPADTCSYDGVTNSRQQCTMMAMAKYDDCEKAQSICQYMWSDLFRDAREKCKEDCENNSDPMCYYNCMEPIILAKLIM